MRTKYIVLLIVAFGVKTWAQDALILSLDGSWYNVKDTTYKEVWHKVNNGLEGKSVQVDEKGKEQIWEVLNLSKEGGGWVYKAAVGNKEAVAFVLSDFSENSLLFANPSHDFPKYIYYKWLNTSTLHIEVYNDIAEGKKLVFDFKKL